MKNFLKGVMKWKTGACLMYTGAMVFYLIFCLVFDSQEVPTVQLWLLLIMCVLGSLIQAVCFSSWIIKKMRYTRRSLLFCALFLPVLAVLGWKGQWFPTERLGSWGIFLSIFFSIFIVMTIGFDIYFQLTGRKYDGLLGQYRKQKEEK